MKNKIIWIVDNPYGEKFTATRTDMNVTSDITREQAKAMLGGKGVWMSARADVQCRAVTCAPARAPEWEEVTYECEEWHNSFDRGTEV